MIDHTNKDPQTKAPTCTAAKLRVVSGVALKVEVIEAFVPGVGGKAALVVYKDRPGGGRKHCPRDSLNPTAGVFTMWCPHGNTEVLNHEVYAPHADSREDEAKSAEVNMLTALKALASPPKTVREIKERMGWGSEKASEAMQLWRKHEQQEQERSARSGNVPGTSGTEELFEESVPEGAVTARNKAGIPLVRVFPEHRPATPRNTGTRNAHRAPALSADSRSTPR